MGKINSNVKEINLVQFLELVDKCLCSFKHSPDIIVVAEKDYTHTVHLLENGKITYYTYPAEEL